MSLLDDLSTQLAILLEAKPNVVLAALNLNKGVIDGLHSPECSLKKTDEEFSHPATKAKCLVKCNQNGHPGLEIKKVALGEDYKILIRTLKVHSKKHCAKNKRAQMLN